MSYDINQLQKILEGAILATGEPLTIDRMLTLFEEHNAPSKENIHEALERLKHSCADRGFSLTEVASGYRFQVKEDLAEWVNRLWEEKPQKYSRAMLETLALIAYRQPITRGDIEEVRGVAVSSHIVKTLVERDWVKIVGHRDVPGRPALYATTRIFLDYFNLKSLDELPTLGELRDIDSLNESLEFDSLPPEVQESIAAAAEKTEENKGEQPIAGSESPSAEEAQEAEQEQIGIEEDAQTEATLTLEHGEGSSIDGELLPVVEESDKLDDESISSSETPTISIGVDHPVEQSEEGVLPEYAVLNPDDNIEPKHIETDSADISNSPEGLENELDSLFASDTHNLSSAVEQDETTTEQPKADKDHIHD